MIFRNAIVIRQHRERSYLCNGTIALALLLLFILNSFSNPLKAQQSLINVNGWNAFVHLPASYSNNPTSKYPTIIFFPGLGEVGYNPFAAIFYGPGAHLFQGWNGNVSVNGSTVEFIIISLQPSSAFPSEYLMNLKLQALKTKYRIDPNRVYLTGLSHGGWCSSTFVTGDPLNGPYTYASQIAAVVTVQGMVPDDNSPYPQLFANFALSGGKYLGFEQTQDGRDTKKVVDKMNATVPNSGIYVQTSYGNGGHCCWTQYYGGFGIQPGIYNLGGINQNIYEWMARQSLSQNTNIPPVANAGNDQTITLPTNTASLSGTANDPDGTIISYAWVKISGPAGGDIANAGTANPVVVNLVQGTYQFEFAVTDNDGAIAKDTMQVKVVAAVNVSPVANAGNDQTITLPTNTATLSGTAADPDGTIVSYAWVKISGPAGGDIANAGTANPVVVNLVQGTYQFQFTVTDNSGAIAKDTMEVKVVAAVNVSPVANAGNDQTITLPINTASLNGTANDPDGTIISYAWVKISGPAGGDIANAGTANPVVVNLVQGTYQFEFAVTDNDGAIAKDTMQVKVIAAVNASPVANAGNDQTITLPINTASLNGTANDPDGTIISFAWVKISGPAGGDIANAGTANPVVVNLVQGTYQFEFAVADNSGTIAKDTMLVEVVAAANIPPVANAGNDQTITLPTNTASLNGTANDPDGTIISYAWVKISGPAGGDIANAGTANPVVVNLVQGTYQFEFAVTDNGGAIAKDTMQVEVVAAANIPPIANAGNDQTITLPTNTASLSGTANDPDGSIASVAWVKISGPAQGEITNATEASTSVINLVQGIYLFEFSAVDNSGATTKDTVKITVNAAANIPPTANAGSDITITLPINSATLSGSGLDSDGTIISYSWLKISGLAIGSLVNSNTNIASATNLVAGVYTYQLTVTDNSGANAKDTVSVTVIPAPNISPIANAGADQVITLPTNGVYLSGTGLDLDGTIISYHWLKIAGPAAGNILDANASSTAAINLIKGMYEYQLTVTDNRGGVGRDAIIIIVNDAPNKPPVAYAGGNATVYLPEDSILLDGKATDTDGFITSHTWRMLSAAGSFQISDPSASQTKLERLQQGVYTLELSVVDNDGASARDTLNISVGSRSRINPRGYVDIYPNPVSGILHTYITSPVADEALAIILCDSKGLVLQKKLGNIIGNSKHETFDLTRLTPGIYFLEFIYGNRLKLVKKVIKI